MDDLIDSQIILNSLEQNIFVKDVNSVYLYANEAYADLIGESSLSIIGKNDLEFFPKEIAEKYRADDAKIAADQEAIDVTEFILIGNEYKIIRTVKKPLFSEGKVIAILGIFLDITEFVNKRKSLEKLEYGLNKAQEITNVGHWELDLVTNELFWSDEVFRIFGLKPQEFGATYEAFLEYIHPDDIELVNDTYMKSLNEKSGYHIKHRIIRKNNEIGFVEERCEHEYDSEGNVIRSIGTVHDITEQKRTQSKLLLVSEVFKNMQDGVMITDAQKHIVEVNKAFTDMTGYTLEDVKGKTPNILSSGWHDNTFYQSIWKDIVNIGQWEGEIIDRKKNGELYTANLNIISIHNEDGILTNYISISNDISKKKEQEKLIHNLAYYDSLTELPNRVLFEERVKSRLPALKRNEKKMALLFIDMDNFKNINDTLGHVVGDKFLIEVAKRIKGTLREQDTLARLGGDEFTVIIEGFKSIDKIVTISEKIINEFKNPLVINESNIYTSSSIGISVYPDDGQSYEELIKAADTAMYRVKDSGKNSFKFYDQSMNKAITQRILLEDNLRHAIKNNEFFLVYQPKIDIKTNSVYGMEALIRWEQPELGLVSPDEFIGVAEETGQIYEIGLWVFEQAVRDLKLIHELFDTLVMSINVSSKQLESENFLNDICKLVDEVGIEKKYIELEITESHIMSNIDRALEILNKFYDLGFKLSIDDFGTGYSSLSYLKQLPVQTIKIDRSFVLDIDIDENDRSIVAAIIAMATALEKDVIAEGSETQEHIGALQSLGCNKIQGYYFSKPIRLDALKEFVVKF